MAVGEEIVGEECMICGNNKHVVLSNRIREGGYDVMKCKNCNFVFLQDYSSIDYSSNYGGLTLSSEWSRDDALIKRSESLKKFNIVVASLINKKKNCNTLEIGASIGASVYGLGKLVDRLNIDCVELNIDEKKFLKERFNVSIFSRILDTDKQYQVVYGHHVFEHFVNPRVVLDEIDKVSSNDCKVYFSLPNFDDFYFHTLNSEQKEKYLTFNFHLAHPYYYTIETFSKLIEDTAWKINKISTIQDYSVLNYFNWYINGVRSKDIESGTKINKNIELLNNNFIDMLEKMQKGNNLSVILEKK